MSGALMDIDGVLAEPLALAMPAGDTVGYFGFDIPADLLACPGLYTAHLPWSRTQATPWADQWLEDSFPGAARCALEDWATGKLDFMRAVVFSRGDDAAQRLYYYVCELQRQGRLAGPTPLIFDVARIPRQSSRDWTVNAVRRLAAELDLVADDLAAGIATANRRRELLRAVDTAHALPGNYRERIARAGLFVPVEQLDIDFDAKHAAPARGNVVLAGSVPPDDGLHLAVETAGWNVVGDVHARSLSRLGPPLAKDNDDPARAIGEHVFANPSGPRSFIDRAGTIVAEARARNADAVILWLFEEDEAFAWDVVGVQAALDQAGIANIVLARRSWNLTDSSYDDIDHFLGGLLQ